MRASRGWTDLVLGAEHPARVVNGLITGWHDPEASHLALLEAVAGTALVKRGLRARRRTHGYLWHEFGDSCLLLPPMPDRGALRRHADNWGRAPIAAATGWRGEAAAAPARVEHVLFR